MVVEPPKKKRVTAMTQMALQASVASKGYQKELWQFYKVACMMATEKLQ